MPARLTLKQVIEKANAVHPNAGYSYDKAIYVNSSTALIITCPVHGDFCQIPNNHINGQGCPSCGQERRTKSISSNLDVFLRKASAVHSGAGYLYERAVYVNNNTSMTITCPVHGDFEQTPQGHLSGRGCRICGTERQIVHNKSRSLRFKPFLEKAQKIHSEKGYSYSTVTFVNGTTHVVITCPRHGVFKQTPVHHLAGQGCPRCGVERNSAGLMTSMEEFMRQARAMHPFAGYDYGKSVYLGAKRKITITCPKHGDFTQTPEAHLRRQGCRWCAVERNTLLRRSTTEKFLEQASLVHAGKGFGYEKVVYVTNRTDVTISCPCHGDFFQSPRSHLNGSGCPVCATEGRGLGLRSDIDRFILAALERHPLAGYGYDNFHYKTSTSKGLITCPVHGDFEQSPNNHLRGRGCPSCAGSISRMGNAWLDDLKISGLIREHSIRIEGRANPLRVDGFDPSTNTVYEFWGDYYHGNPEIYDQDAFDSKACRRTYGQKYADTMRKATELRLAGYRLVAIWERDFLLGNPGRSILHEPLRSVRPLLKPRSCTFSTSGGDMTSG